MIKITCALLLTLVFTTSTAYSMPATTKGGQVACLSQEWYSDMVNFVASDDRDSFASYINTKRCVVAKKGLRVTVTDSPGMFGGTAGFIFKGQKFWTAREALNYGD